MRALSSHPCLVMAHYLDTYNDLIRTGAVEPRCVEQLVASSAARAVLRNLSLPTEARITAGREIVSYPFDWNSAGEAFAQC
jgi:hypothetical protein